MTDGRTPISLRGRRERLNELNDRVRRLMDDAYGPFGAPLRDYGAVDLAVDLVVELAQVVNELERRSS